MPNRLINEKSPYLLQHAHQPVDWYPWSSEAFEKAKIENKPVFLSIGYSTCHWCHVMAHECFDDKEVADLLNRHFVSIKVDKEERPDVDQVYMTFCQLMRGHCGWPLSVFMTPDKKPFFVGTYFPKIGRYGLPGFLEILEKIAYLWTNNRAEVEQTASSILKLSQQALTANNKTQEKPIKGEVSSFESILHSAYRSLERSFDHRWGGFGPAPKFPTPHQLRFLLRYYDRYGVEKALYMAEKTLWGMATGGMYDQLGGGFHRYSVDEKWLIPHFEKMLYDQALIPMAYLEAWQITKNPSYLDIVNHTVEFVLRELTSPDGGFYSAQDADVDGKEGIYYLWTKDEIFSILGHKDGIKACEYWGVEGEGNFEGRFVLYRALDRLQAVSSDKALLNVLPSEVVQWRQKLLEARGTRPKPFTDNKILASWNGLMIALCARTAMATGNDQYISDATRAANFIFDHLFSEDDGKLFHCYCDGSNKPDTFLEDYAFFVWGLLELFISTSNSVFLTHARALVDQMLLLFWDDQDRGFYFTPKTRDDLPIKPKDFFDGATPSGNSVAFNVLLTLDQILGSGRYEEIAYYMLENLKKTVSEAPLAYTNFLCGIDLLAGPRREIFVFPNNSYSLVKEIKSAMGRLFAPRTVFVIATQDNISAIPAMSARSNYIPSETDENTIVQICEDKTCQRPMPAEVFLKNLAS